MIFKGRNIGSGDAIFMMDGTKLIIDSWSPGTGEVWGNLPNGNQTRLNDMEDDLTWYPPFKSSRRQPIVWDGPALMGEEG
jgi:hypothetical protein